MITLRNKKDKLRRSYSFGDMIELALCLFRTKMLDYRIRMIRRPFVLRGRKYIDFGRGLTTGYWCRFEAFPLDNDSRILMRFGDNIQINDFVHVSAMDSVEIGDGCMFASHVYVSDNKHGRYDGGPNDSSPYIQPDHREYVTAPVKIGRNCWLGEGVIVMPGVTIGDGCVIGAHLIVNRNIESCSLAVGAPANVIKRYNQETQCWEKITK